ncbi:hypothetical protein RQP53_07710 [Paucibacter sp. APW11]|uniref:DUF4132 domain-containing protein n=1 Tax=Roseateles aquae TaxID=3077235 RepID=A0ABU3P998_9BURK|nr:hypothetical protein [Paucibacter sp. APW11]MDT8999151.1 hypothetical protein [Paucibacter sp. APW11]
MPTARDGYREYYAEKLWDWVPAIHREMDAQQGGDALRALLHAIASQAAVQKRSQDRLWDDMFIELADDWALPYIAQLVATRLVSALSPRARRADVAKTIYYRRRKGTPAVLEQLVADMSGWTGHLVEEFRRLGRLRHGLDGVARLGRLSATPEGGLADLRQVRAARLAGDAFDEFHYTPEMRRPALPAGRLGLRGIHVLGFHLWRMQSVAFDGVQPARVIDAAGTRDGYTCDPSGRDVPLFSAPDASGNAGVSPMFGAPRDWSAWRSADEWALPRVIDCRLLNEAIYEVNEAALAWVLSAGVITPAQRAPAAAELAKLLGQRFANSAEMARTLAGRPSGMGAVLGAAAVLDGLRPLMLRADCGSAALLADASGQTAQGRAPAASLRVLAGTPVPRERSRGAQLSSWTATLPAAPAGVDWLLDPALGRFVYDSGAADANQLRLRYRTGQLAPIGAGAWARTVDATPATVHWAQRSTAGGVPASGILEIDDNTRFEAPPNQAGVSQLSVRAAAGTRPYLRLNADWVLQAAGAQRTLLLDGLWLGAAIGATARLVIAGDWARVQLRYCTLDPGGSNAVGATLPPVKLIITGTVDELVVDSSIVAGIQLEGAAASVDTLQMRDCIVDARAGGPIDLPNTAVTLSRCTLLGIDVSTLCLHAERLWASDTLIAGIADISNVQQGCFRFSARAPGSRLPHPYESQLIDDVLRLFATRRFGDPAYASLSPRAPASLFTGSEQGSEIGAFCASLFPIKLDSLRAKVEEYMPFARLPAYLLEN